MSPNEGGPSSATHYRVAAQSGIAIFVPRLSSVQIIDPEGSQVADVFAFLVEDSSEWMSTSHTRAVCRKLFPDVGESFVTNQYRPILTFMNDDSPGQHDMLYPACEPAMYRRLGVQGHHPSCRENYLNAVRSAWSTSFPCPDPVNLFQNSPVSSDGDLVPDVATSGPGDSVTLRAELDLMLVVTACSPDVVQISGEQCTPIHLEVSAP